MPKRRRGDGGVAAETREAKLVGVLFPGEIFDGVVRGEIMAVEACAAGSTEAEVGGFGAAEGGGGGGGTVKAEFGGGEEGRRGGIVGRLRGRERRAPRGKAITIFALFYISTLTIDHGNDSTVTATSGYSNCKQVMDNTISSGASCRNQHRPQASC